MHLLISQVAGSSPAVHGKSMEFLQLLHPIFRPRDVRLLLCRCFWYCCSYGLLFMCAMTAALVLAGLEPCGLGFRVCMQDLNKSEQSTVDNACSAVASMLLHAPPSGLPMADVVRVFVSSLPLAADREESKTVLQALIHLAATQPAIVLQNAQQFMFVSI